MDAGLRDQVWHRAGGRCEYCHLTQEFDVLPFQVDHVVPRKHGGPTLLENLTLSCLPCNARKGPNLAGLDPESGVVVSLFNPRTQAWGGAFRVEWSSARRGHSRGPRNHRRVGDQRAGAGRAAPTAHGDRQVIRLEMPPVHPALPLDKRFRTRFLPRRFGGGCRPGGSNGRRRRG